MVISYVVVINDFRMKIVFLKLDLSILKKWLFFVEINDIMYYVCARLACRTDLLRLHPVLLERDRKKGD